MSNTNTRHFVIEHSHFCNLEYALSVAVPAAQSLGCDTGIFWLRGSIFAATPYASVGLANLGLELGDGLGCLAISQTAAKQLLVELRISRARFLEEIGIIAMGNDIIFTFDYDSSLKLNVPSLLSYYLNWWQPRITPSEHYALLIKKQPYFSNQLYVGEVREKLQSREDCGFVVIDDLYPDYTPISISRLLLLSLLNAVEDNDEMFHIEYYDYRHCFVYRVGDVIAIVSTIE
jgi:hypothetical protein